MIAILMATYNSEQYVAQQIDSILAQDSDQWHLYIHDDGSSDSTPDILRSYAASHPQLITVMQYPGQGGALPNFMSMLERVEADYYMFSDHDDVWHATKVSRSMESMNIQEAEHPDVPVVVHCDVRVVDDQLRLIHPSYREYGHIYPSMVTCFDECVVNITLGCAMLFNRKAREAALDRPWKHALMHDGWVTTRTFAEGGVVYAIPEALMEYRQTGNNTNGAIDGNRFTLLYRLRNIIPMLRLNIAQYRMLRSAGYGSIFKYYAYKFRNHIH